MWNMTGDSALICSVDCLAHTSPHVGASLGLPATLILPPNPALPPSPFPPHAPLHPHTPSALFAGSPKCHVFSRASVARRRWARGSGAQPPPPLPPPPAAVAAAEALPLKDNAVYCICQLSIAILCKSIAHLLPCTWSRRCCASTVQTRLCYLANWLMPEGLK